MATRHRCKACGNLTRFTVTRTRRTEEFLHYSIGGDPVIEETVVLFEEVEKVDCRWCDSPDIEEKEALAVPDNQEE